MLALGDRSTVALTAGGNYSHALSVACVSVITVVAGQSVSWSGLIADGASAGSSSSVGPRRIDADQCSEQLLGRDHRWQRQHTRY
jgi:hypothetical protein